MLRSLCSLTCVHDCQLSDVAQLGKPPFRLRHRRQLTDPRSSSKSVNKPSASRQFGAWMRRTISPGRHTGQHMSGQLNGRRLRQTCSQVMSSDTAHDGYSSRPPSSMAETQANRQVPTLPCRRGAISKVSALGESPARATTRPAAGRVA